MVDKLILDRWGLTHEELTEVIDKNPSLRGMLVGYIAEEKLEKYWLSSADITEVTKHDDHDRKKKGDRVITYKGHQFIFESKSLQSLSVKKTEEGWSGRAQVDASDRRPVTLPDGSNISTTCLLKGEFDILAVNLFAFEGKWCFTFAKNSDLPTSKYGKYTEYERRHLLASTVHVHWPPKPPFTDEPFSLMNQIIQEHI